MLILLFAIVCAAGIVFLFWQLKDSDRVTDTHGPKPDGQSS